MIRIHSQHVLKLAAMIAIVAGGLAVLVPAVEQLHGVLRPAPATRTIAASGRAGGQHRIESSARRGDDSEPRAAVHQPSGGRHTRGVTRTSLGRTVGKIERALVRLGLVVLAIVALGLLWVLLTGARRLHNRGRRDYRRWQLHLSMHDEAKPEDLADMVEALVDALRPRLGRRIQSGQPFAALELIYDGVEWMLCVVCDQRSVATLEGIITQAYPDVWLGREFEEARTPVSFVLGRPGHVLRFHKRRDWMLPLSRPGERSTDRRMRPSSAIEGIARAQVAAGSPSVVRFLLLPMAEGFERRMGDRLSTWERRMQREHQGASDSGNLTLSQRAQLQSAVGVQHRSLLFLEVQVGAPDWDTANAIASSVMSKRGENHLHRRYMRVRQRLYRRRFASATPPWLPSRRSIVSSAEMAFLFELPSARMKSVPVRRITRPRIPRPPEAAKPDAELKLPPQGAGSGDKEEAPGPASDVVPREPRADRGAAAESGGVSHRPPTVGRGASDPVSDGTAASEAA